MKGPTRVKGASKFSGYCPQPKGRYSSKSFPGLQELPKSLMEAVIKASNNSLANGTWQNYKVVETHLNRCQKIIGRRFEFPFTNNSVLVFVAYLLDRDNLKSSTIENYLSALRILHMTEGHIVTNLRPDIIRTLLKGKSNEDAIWDRKKEEKLPVTVEVLALMREILLADTRMDRAEKAAIWAIACMCFFGSLRLGEVLSEKARTIDPRFDMLRRDVVIKSRKVGSRKRRFLELNLKSPKESGSNSVGIRIEIFDTPDCYCPVAAFEDYEREFGALDPKNAVFRLHKSGDAISKARFNRVLKAMLKPHVTYGKITGHSFRSGISSLMGRAGFSDSDIQCLGRWSSEAYRKYIKLGRLIRVRNADKISKFVNSQVEAL